MPIKELSTNIQAPINQIKVVCQALDDKKALELKILDVSESSSITDYFILATGNSIPHLRALCGAVERELKAQKIKILGVDNKHQSGWIVIDGFDFMVHVFLPEMRDNYSLDTLWKDAAEIQYSELIA